MTDKCCTRAQNLNLFDDVFVQVRLLAEARADLNADGKSLRASGRKS